MLTGTLTDGKVLAVPVQALRYEDNTDKSANAAKSVASVFVYDAGKAVKRAFQVFVHALLPRVLEAGKAMDGQALRWAIEDAWRNPLAL